MTSTLMKAVAKLGGAAAGRKRGFAENTHAYCLANRGETSADDCEFDFPCGHAQNLRPMARRRPPKRPPRTSSKPSRSGTPLLWIPVILLAGFTGWLWYRAMNPADSSPGPDPALAEASEPSGTFVPAPPVFDLPKCPPPPDPPVITLPG